MLSINRYNVVVIKDPTDMDHATSIGYLLQHTATILQRQFDHVLQQKLGIGMAQFKILMILQQKPHIQQRKLAECLGQTEASISRQVKLLEHRELLNVEIDPESRRTHHAIVTPAGLHITQEAITVLRQTQAPMLELLTDKQQRQLIEILHSIHNYACAEGKPFACDHPFNI